MPLEEKYEMLFDRYALAIATSYAFHKELGVVDKSHAFSVKVMKKMLPSLIAYKVAKAITPVKAFKKAVDQYLYAIRENDNAKKMVHGRKYPNNLLSSIMKPP